MKKILDLKGEKEFDTKTLFQGSDIEYTDALNVNTDTHEAIDLKTLTKASKRDSEGKATQVYSPKPLTPDDEIYDNIMEQFASSPTIPKYWFEEFGDYWSCSCGHVNRGDYCKNCGLERELLRSLFILHKPADANSTINSRVEASREKADIEEKLFTPPQTDTASNEKDTADNADISATTESNEGLPPPQDTPDKSPVVASLPTSVEAQTKSKNKRIILFIVLACLLIAGGVAGYAIYEHYAAPAEKYDEALALKSSGKYDKAIAAFQSLGDYKDSRDMIWQCYMDMGDAQFKNKEYDVAINTYKKAQKLKDIDTITDKIWKCYLSIGDIQYEKGEYEKAMSTYTTAMEIKNSETIDDKIKKCKFDYVKKYLADRSPKVEEYLGELMNINYPGIEEIYDSYYAWNISIIANTEENNFSTDLQSASRTSTIYFHTMLSGGKPSEEIEFYYEIIWPNGSKQAYELESKWKSGAKITAQFQYPVPLFGTEGKLTFILYDRSTNNKVGEDSIQLSK